MYFLATFYAGNYVVNYSVAYSRSHCGNEAGSVTNGGMGPWTGLMVLWCDMHRSVEALCSVV